ncbi:MAG: hypothetical protein ACFFB2_13435 [Promethearchaeota archaeon]
MKCTGSYALGKFIGRPTRFLAKIELGSANQSTFLVEAHVADPGRLKELLLQNTPVILQKRSNPTRKTQYSLVGVKTKETWVNIDSQQTNRLFKEEFYRISRFKGLRIIQSWYNYGKSRFDFLMLTQRPIKKH